MRTSRLQRLRQAIAARKYRSTKGAASGPVDLEGLACLLLDVKALNPTQRDFIFDSSRVSLFIGPLGSAKTVSLVASLLIPALFYPGSTWGLFRGTWWTLKETTLFKFTQALDRLGPGIIVDKSEGPPYVVYLQTIRLGEEDDGPTEPAKFVCYGLDELSKLGSMEFTGIGVDEANEINIQMASTLDSRLRQPLPGRGVDHPFFLRFCMNPPNRSHWGHTKFCREADCEPVSWGKKHRALKEENAHNLPTDYYETVAKGMTPDMKVRLIEGECGPDPSGMPVYPEFRSTLHVSELSYQAPQPIIRGWDFGRRRPACVWASMRPDGCMDFLYCLLGHNENLDIFAGKVIAESARLFPGCTFWRDYVDPHGAQKRDVSEKSSHDVLREKGIAPLFRDVTIDTGIRQVSEGLCQLINGRPKFMFDRYGCNLVIEGFASGYSWPTIRPGHAMKETPVADGFYEHLMDAVRYIAVNLNLGSNYDKSKLPRNLRAIRGGRSNR